MNHQPSPKASSRRAVVGIGGNSLIRDPEHPEVEHQWKAVGETCRHLVRIIEEGWSLVITHGNGPQVGFILRRNELAAEKIHTTPIDLIGADTQGAIGYMLSQQLGNCLVRAGNNTQVVTLVTRVLVDREDPAFQNPAKPIGGFLSEPEARAFEASGWQVVQDAGRGFRRVIASPEPKKILEGQAVVSLLEQGYVVVAVGGGGIPVLEVSPGSYRGVAAVVDKDLATSLLATDLGARFLLISTSVEKVALDFQSDHPRWLGELTVAQAKKHMADGQFAPGSMQPKLEAAIRFLEGGGEEVIITNPENIGRALDGHTGTRIRP